VVPFVWNFRGHGVLDVDVPLPVGPDSKVVASATELGIFNGEEAPFIGLASIQVVNIAPGVGSARIRVNIMWNDDLNVRVNGVVIE
jgi:hypothetical protein